ncbi:MAG TPA: 16S rRNA (guanine(527)-N(7))-methyltransferase RsmG [Anaeromyxobacteraceae bacterium]|nr:16S rRNA (guanine(527)-N(7))-methyltransferase RsmG [Anaeromyxobacteraceae bacterium]
MSPEFGEALDRGLSALGLVVPGEARALLETFAERLLAWNRKVNLTAVTGPAELAEKHFVDSLALLPSLGPARTLLDVGSGAGLPGMALACARRDLEVTCCDASSKKVAFAKAVSAELGLRVRAVAVRAQGNPSGEGLPLSEAVVSRALADPAEWIPLGARYLAAEGRLFAMLGQKAEVGPLARLAEAAGLALEVLHRFTLPLSGSRRAIARFRREGDVPRGT